MLLVATVGLCSLLLLASPSSSQDSGRYTGTADARLFGVNFTTAPPLVFDQLVDAGVGVSQAELDSAGRSAAFASTPYPSESVLLLPGLVAGLTQGQTSGLIPEYPLVASSNYPLRPSEHVSAGPVSLDAESGTASSRGSASDGGNQAIASVTVDETTSEVTSRSETTISSVRLTDALTLFGVRSFAEVSQTPGGEIERVSGFEVAAVSILGQRIAVTAEGLTIAGQELPGGLDLGGALAPLLETLAGSGTTLEYVPAEELDDGIRSAGLRVRIDAVPPPDIASGLERVVTEVTFGANAVTLQSRTFEDGLTGAVPVGVDSSDGSAGASTGGPAFTTPGISEPPSAQDSTAPSEVAAAQRATFASSASVSVAAFYPVLLVVACLVLAATGGFRHLAVRQS